MKLTNRDISEAQHKLTRWAIAERFGWSLEYIDGLALAEIHDLIQIDDGREKARPKFNIPKGRH